MNVDAVMDCRGGNATAMLLSAGLDSYMVWRLIGSPPAIFFRSGVSGNWRESMMIDAIRVRFPAADIKVVEGALGLGPYEEASGYVPYRNLLYILIASLEMPRHDFVIGQVSEWQTDKNASFYRRAERLVRDLGYRDIRVTAPYADMTRTEVMRRFIARGFDPLELIETTSSCLFPSSSLGSTLPCGQCSNCINRWIAFRNNGLSERMAVTPTRAMWEDNARAQRRIFKWWLAPMYARRYFEARRAFALDARRW